jgi:hypothetical protein
MGRCGKYVDFPGHTLVYYCENNTVWYIDGQLYDDGCIFNNIKSKYRFADQHQININTF